MNIVDQTGETSIMNWHKFNSNWSNLLIWNRWKIFSSTDRKCEIIFNCNIDLGVQGWVRIVSKSKSKWYYLSSLKWNFCSVSFLFCLLNQYLSVHVLLNKQMFE